MNKRSVGSLYENAAADFITEKGAKILIRNYRCRIGEVDIIARDEDYICFIEVKYRKDDLFGGPEAAVNFAKQRKISKVSAYYLLTNNMSEFTKIRYDVIAIDGTEGAFKFHWYKDAFNYC